MASRWVIKSLAAKAIPATLTLLFRKIVCALHARFPESFTVPFVQSLTASLQSGSPTPSAASGATALSGVAHGTSAENAGEMKEKEDNARIGRQRGLLRVFAELELVGIVRVGRDGKGRDKDGNGQEGEATLKILKELVCITFFFASTTGCSKLTLIVGLSQLTSDKDLLALSIPLAVSFVKYLGSFFLPVVSLSAEGKPSTDPTPAESMETGLHAQNDGSIVGASQKEKFKKLLTAYYDALSRRSVRDHTVSQLISSRLQYSHLSLGARSAAFGDGPPKS